jgi:cytochrome c553
MALLLSSMSAASAGGLGSSQITPSQARASSMRHHFENVNGAVDAVIRKDLSQARAQARLVLAEPDPAGLPERGRPQLLALRAQAERAARAADLEQVATAVSSMLAACGDCHRAVGTMPAHPAPVEPKVGGVLGHMDQHRTAADLLTQGLTTPSSSLWKDGADVLATAPLQLVDLPDPGKIPRDGVKTEARIHALATRARAADDTAARVQIYSELILACSTCHATNPR